nr:reverse transcriptase domain-containing protein [Tanacetum cinerariifolium]
MLSGFFQNQSSTSGTLPSNTIPNPKGEMKAITTRSGVAYEDLQFLLILLLNSFAHALLLMPKFASKIKSLLTNKDKLFELAKIPLNENCPAMLLKKLPKSLEILTTRYSSAYDDLLVNRIDIINDAREEYAQEILGFSKKYSGGNPTSTSEPILSDSSPSLTPFEGSDFILEEIETYLKDESISLEINHADCDSKGDICLIEKLLNNDPFQLPLIDLKQGEEVKAKYSIEEPSELRLKDLPSHLEYAYLEGVDKLPVIIAKDLKDTEKEALLKVLKSHKRAIAWKITDIKGIDPRFYTHKILMEEEYKPVVESQRRVNPKIYEVDRAKVDVIAKLPYPTAIKGVRSFLGHAGFYRRFIQDFSKIARPMTHLLEKKTLFVFSKDCINAFETLKKKFIEAPILVVPDWNLPSELMCDASDFAIGAVLGERKTKHFQPIHYTSKTMIKVQIHYTMTEKEMLAAVYAFEYFRPYLVLSKSIVYTDHLALKYLLSKQDAKPRFGTPRAIISDRGTHFCNDKFAKVMSKYGVTHRLATAYHPQKSRQVEVSNRGPFTITKVFPYGTVELSQPDGPNFKVNGHHVKHYFGGDVPQLVVPDLQTYPMEK